MDRGIRHRSAPTCALVIGESLTDRIVGSTGVTEHPGGSPMNLSIGLARQGVDVQFVTELGADQRGDRIEVRLVREGVDLLTPLRSGTTAIAHARLSDDGSARYRFDLCWTLATGMLPHRPVDVVHFGSLASAIEPGASVVERHVAALRESTTVTYDPNIRPDVDGDREAGRDRVERHVALSDVVKASHEDLAWLYPGEKPERIARRWMRSSTALVVITRADRGATIITRHDTVEITGRRVPVVDTIGAGDAFMAGLIAGLGTLDLLGADRRSALADVESRALRAVGQWAQRSALTTIMRAGAEPPTSAELLDRPQTQPAA